LRRIEKSLQEGRLDVLCALLDTPRRHQIAHRLSTPVYAVRERLVALRSEALSSQGFDDLARTGALVATQAGASYADKLRQHGVAVDETDTVAALRNIVRHRVRYYYGNELTCVYYIKAGRMSAELGLVPGVMGETPSHFWAARHLEPALVKRLDAALIKLKRNGTLERIYNRYAEMN
jgi:ABC-type amino acid transport substrate-binding protein